MNWKEICLRFREKLCRITHKDSMEYKILLVRAALLRKALHKKDVSFPETQQELSGA